VKIALIDYGAGNLHSAAKAIERAAADGGLSVSITVDADPASVRAADRILLPGDGAFRDCMANLRASDGLIDALTETVIGKARPFLGICVGMQLLASQGLEHGATPGLGWIAGDVRRIAPARPAFKIPHMGWNTLFAHRGHALLKGIPLGPAGLHAYFLHSYHLVAADDADVVAEADYAGPITAIVARGNIAGAQFHPEKSQTLGLALLRNFLMWAP
jgi:imidazole glycerol-phosphate synthase subunit HisH